MTAVDSPLDESAVTPPDLLADATQRIARLSGVKRTIGIIRMWPEQACAEHECVERLRTAAELVGVRVIELDKCGHIVGTPRQRVAREDVDFVIHREDLRCRLGGGHVESDAVLLRLGL